MRIMQIRRYISVIFFFTLILTGCITDHDLEIVPTVLLTLPFEYKNQNFVFSIQAEQLGNRKVTEYGIVYTAYYRGVGDHNLFPTVEDHVLPFESALVEGLNQQVYSKDFINGRSFFYYRTYAKFEDRSIVYGNRLTFTN